LGFPALSIPCQPLRLQQNPAHGFAEVWDVWRHRWIQLTGEEWVRQQFLHWLVAECAYPAGRIQVEQRVHGLKKNRRFDALVLAKNGSPFMILEFKAPEIQLNNETFMQIAHYNRTVRAPYLLVSNGIQTFIARMQSNSTEVEFMQDIPPVD
jgi:hypothetical protein